MATGQVADNTAVAGRSAKPAVSPAYAVLRALGSLKITVVMFALAMFIVLVGTLAQDDLDMAQVKRGYFHCWVSSVPLDVFAPTTLWEHDEPYLSGAGFFFPGGATIGLILLINLIAAKTTRFSVHAKGQRLFGGWLISALGAGLIFVVILSGHASDGLQGKPPISYDTVWQLMRAGFMLLTVVLAVFSFKTKLPPLAKNLVRFAAISSFFVCVLLIRGGESVRLDDPGLRIVWQFLQATIASSVLFAGLWLVFGKRGGNVLIHVGVGLLMVGQFVFGDRQIEQRVALVEGETTNMVVTADEVEIVFIDASDADEEKVIAIREHLFRSARSREVLIEDERLPCKVKVLKWMKNSELVAIAEGDENLATAGVGLIGKAVEQQSIGGAEMNAQNFSSAYVQLLDKSTNEPIASLLLSQFRNDVAQMTFETEPDQMESAEIDGKAFQIGIRNRQERKPYDVLLKDVQRINYSGTETPRDYSSRIVVTDRETGQTQEGKTWMNNPFRYRGETFYQSSYNKVRRGGVLVETTGLQVVKNAGWIIPYVSCMMVWVGMFAHFGGTFLTFANRYERGNAPGSKIRARATGSIGSRATIAVISLLVVAAFSAAFARTPSVGEGEVDWNVVAQLPVQHEGRIKPFDTVARNVLQVISKPMFGMSARIKDSEGKRYTPTQWLMGVIAGQSWVEDVAVFRIYATEVRDLFDLEPRKGYRYSYNELGPGMEKYQAEVAKLRNKSHLDFDMYEERLAGMHKQVNLFLLLRYSYQMPPLPNPEGLATEAARSQYIQRLGEIAERMRSLEDGQPPGMIPPAGAATHKNLVDARWQSLGPAAFAGLMSKIGLVTAETSPALLPLDDMLAAMQDGDAERINKSVQKYHGVVAELPLAEVSMERAATESWLNRYNPTVQGVALYIIAALLGFASFLVRVITGRDGLRKTTFWLLVGVFVIHTIALIARVYISGRAPVINLYSSAVFIGWACVLLALFLESLYPLGVANLVAGLIGASTLSVARFLDTSDTLHVLQAVLDTQFWLSTHVITVTAGYAVTFLAGFLAICALVHRMWTGLDSYSSSKRPAESVEIQQVLDKMIFGVICFAMFFSFIGTVLGGLWADDSWGRFWGWDPKENGALMIVLWNALLLHARWDKQVGIRGFAVLAVLGNIVTAWSWFGTNQLGIGLHSYGFTNGALVSLAVFMGLNLLFLLVVLVVTSAMSAGARRLERE